MLSVLSPNGSRSLRKPAGGFYTAQEAFSCLTQGWYTQRRRAAIAVNAANPLRIVSAKKSKKNPSRPSVGDGVIRIQREVKGRKGKTVTTLSGFDIDQHEIKKLAAQLKSRCGTGGSAKDGVIVIQGDHREIVLAELKKAGYQAKLAGG